MLIKFTKQNKKSTKFEFYLVNKEGDYIKVIRKGTDKNYDITCWDCRSDILFKMSDTFLHTPKISYLSCDKHGKCSTKPCDGVTTLHIKCPVCGHYVDTGMR